MAEADPLLIGILAEIYPDTAAEPVANDLAEIKALVAAFARAELPDCTLLIVHGSAARSERIRHSDVDILAATAGSDRIVRRIVTYRNLNFDVLETGVDRLEMMLRRSRATGDDYVVSALAFGTLLQDDAGVLPALRRDAVALLTTGPDPSPQLQIDQLRAHVTSLVSQMCRSPDRHEQMMAGLDLFAPLMSLERDARRSWSFRGKHLARAFDRVDPSINQRLHAAYQALLDDQPAPLALLARDIITRSGGWLTAGFLSVATFPKSGQ